MVSVKIDLEKHSYVADESNAKGRKRDCNTGGGALKLKKIVLKDFSQLLVFEL